MIWKRNKKLKCLFQETNPNLLTVLALHANLLLSLVNHGFLLFSSSQCGVNSGMFSEHLSTAGAFVRIHLMLTTILGDRYSYSSHNTDELTEAGKGTCLSLFSWQLTGRAGIWNRTRFGFRPFLNQYVMKMRRLTGYLWLSPFLSSAAGQSTNAANLTFEKFHIPLL